MEKEFTPITLSTQEEMQSFIDSKVGERLARQEKKHSEATYELQTKFDEQSEQFNALKKSFDDISGKYAESDKTIAELNAKVKSYETASVKARICRENNIPDELSDFIKGETEEDMKASAEILAKHTKGFKTSMPPASSEPVQNNSGDDVRNALTDMVKGLNR